MKNLINSMIIAFSMYSKIPMPKTDWKEENFKFAFAFFPFVGLVIGVLIYAVYCLMLQFQSQTMFFAAMAILINVVITGGIHIDGFCDVMDAQSSHKEKEEKLRIMKDPHVGAFAVIYTAVLLIVQFGAYAQLFYSNKYILAVALTFAVSRMFSGLSIVLFPCAKESGLAAIFAKGASKKPIVLVLTIMLMMSFVAIILLYGWFGLVFLAAALLLFLWFYYFSKNQFGGITGDLAGYFLNIFETVMLFIAIIGGAI